MAKEVSKKELEIQLTEEEKKIIESQREAVSLLQEFRTSYEDLVKRTGYAWVVDGNSPLNDIKLGIAKIR